jgi:lysophospholipase L1-like esterase
MKFLATLLAASVPMMAMAIPEPTDTVTVFMIGDSTMANKPLAKENQERGWGQMLPIYLQGKIKVDNHAVNGRSSKSFMDEGRWDKVMEKLRPGDFVIIQFGHNDEKEKSPDRYTVPGGSFDDNLRRYVNDTKSKGATPILMNSIARRNFPPNAGLDIASESDDKQNDWKGKYPNEGVILVDTHGAYLDSPRNVAAETGVTFIDMNKLTHKLVQELGPSASRDLFMWIPADTYEFCPKGKIDNTHLNVLGGIMVSRLAVNALAAQVPELREYIRPEVYNLK